MMREFTGDQTIYINIYFTKNEKYTDIKTLIKWIKLH